MLWSYTFGKSAIGFIAITLLRHTIVMRNTSPPAQRERYTTDTSHYD